MPTRKTNPAVVAVPDLSDVQNHVSPHTIDIDKVGVKNISYPIVVLDKFNGTQHTVARINMYVNLPHRHKGNPHEPVYRDPERIPPGCQSQKDRTHPGGDPRRLNAQSAHLEMTFPYFIDKEAPTPGPGA